MNDDEIGARIQIQYTLALYNNSVDKGDVDGVISAFAETATLATLYASCRGRPEIRGFYEKAIGPSRSDWAPGDPIPLIRHNITTSRVEFDSATGARGWTYFLVVSKHGLDHFGIYTDIFAKFGDRWLIADRKISVDWYATPSWYQLVRMKAQSGAAKG